MNASTPFLGRCFAIPERQGPISLGVRWNRKFPTTRCPRKDAQDLIFARAREALIGSAVGPAAVSANKCSVARGALRGIDHLSDRANTSSGAHALATVWAALSVSRRLS
jgi:hypothetical protein